MTSARSYFHMRSHPHVLMLGLQTVFGGETQPNTSQWPTRLAIGCHLCIFQTHFVHLLHPSFCSPATPETLFFFFEVIMPCLIPHKLTSRFPLPGILSASTTPSNSHMSFYLPGHPTLGIVNFFSVLPQLSGFSPS